MKIRWGWRSGILLAAAAVAGWPAGGRAPGQERGTFTFTCPEIADVKRGAGLAVVLETPGGKTYLYDTGNGYPEKGGWAGGYNAGRDTILPYLRAKGIRALDGVL